MSTMVSTSLSAFKMVVGRARNSVLTPPLVQEFIFSMKRTSDGLRVVASDFKKSSWEASLSELMLHELQEKIGIRGGFDDFLLWMHDAFSSEIVRFSIDEEPSAATANGGNQGTLTGQRLKDDPRVRIKLRRIEGQLAMDAMAALGFDLFQHSTEQTLELAQEKAKYEQLGIVLAAERARAEDLSQQLHELVGKGQPGRRRAARLHPPGSQKENKKSLNERSSHDRSGLTQADTQSPVASQTAEVACSDVVASQNVDEGGGVQSQKRTLPTKLVSSRRVRHRGQGTKIEECCD